MIQMAEGIKVTDRIKKAIVIELVNSEQCNMFLQLGKTLQTK